ncbi:MAG: outer membrane lipoprotein-sorting protein [candidate division Zixibacteria bacterium]|nr:outer membrane lipoprotein-sorting protein [candidate division Zixibacteria bacterium]
MLRELSPFNRRPCVLVWSIVAAVMILRCPTALSQTAALGLMNQSHLAYYYAGDGGHARVNMILSDGRGRTQTREFWIARRDIADMGDQNYYTYFLKPADVARTALVIHKKAQANDDRWLYVPALDLVKRIAADDRRASFVGSDFTYEDISGRLPSLDKHEAIGPDSALGRAATKVKSTPVNPKTADYAWRVTWVDVDSKLPLREEYYDARGTLQRRFEITKIETIEGIPTATERTMTNLQSGHSTTIRFTDVTYKPDLKAEDFNERLLKNPPAAFTR